jgi:hypothetical protein
MQNLTILATGTEMGWANLAATTATQVKVMTALPGGLRQIG